MTTTSFHWADQIAEQILHQKPPKKRYVFASGITPSGTVHVGNFREIITVDLVRRAMQDKGHAADFLFFWDDYDVFRKVPQNLPHPQKMKAFLGLPLTKVPDPWEKKSSYAEHHIDQLESSLMDVGITPTFIYQSQEYQQGRYTQRIKQALSLRHTIQKLLNQHRTSPLQDDWYPVTVYCETCHYAETTITDHDEKYTLTYYCSRCHPKTNEKRTIDFRLYKNIKLLWRVDWPMRWADWNVDFEPGGKDHSSDGGSFDTASKLVKAIYRTDPPVYRMYDFILIKGQGGKMSSSQGNVMSLADALKVYEPVILRHLFASYRPNVEFSIAMDTDVINNYESFDRMERIAYDPPPDMNAITLSKIKRTYTLSLINKTDKNIPYQASFRHLGNILQIHDFDYDAVTKAYEKNFKNPHDRVRFQERLQRGQHWIKHHAPHEFRFQVRTKKVPMKELFSMVSVPDPEPYKNALIFLRHQIKSMQPESLPEKILQACLYSAIERFDLNAKTLYAILYVLLIGRTQGPRLASFMFLLGKKRILELI